MSKFKVTSSVSPTPKRYIVSSTIVSTLEKWFQEAGSIGVEDFAVLAGFVTSDGDAVVVTALHPDAERAPGWYEQRDSPAWHDLYQFGRVHDMVYLIQAHTHPVGYSTQHSPRDNAGAFVDKIGFVSVVLPDFALEGIELYDSRVTVHERTPTGWRIWGEEEVKNRIIVVPSAVDYQTD